MDILVTGATGYVGGRLIPKLLTLGHHVRCLVRDASRMPATSWATEVEVFEGDVLQPESLTSALDGVDAAYYLIHSMASTGTEFEKKDVVAARNFGQAAKRAAVDRIIYLGGIRPKTERLSTHLQSRLETGDVLRESGVSVTEFRAAVIVGSGSLSFELIRYLTERVPLLITPKWVRTPTQPIGIRDVLRYLTASLEVPDSRGKIIEIGGRDVLTYGEMFTIYAKVRGLKRPIINVPVLTPGLSSLWVGLVTPVNSRIARPLIEGLDNEVVVTDDKAAKIFGFDLLSYEEAVNRALQRFQSDRVETHWSGAVSSGREPSGVHSSIEELEGLISEENLMTVLATPETIFAILKSLGGDVGWLYANVLWKIRGVIDTLVGGVGMRKSRRSVNRLQVGDTIDFWRVEMVEENAYLLLRAEMKLPGTAWLEFKLTPVDEQQTLVSQIAAYEPKGLPGIMYWYLFSLPHRFIFPGMLKEIGKRAEAAQSVISSSRTLSDARAPVTT
jgi:uncharacterized protein YbjT (DUF2867 family)